MANLNHRPARPFNPKPRSVTFDHAFMYTKQSQTLTSSREMRIEQNENCCKYAVTWYNVADFLSLFPVLTFDCCNPKGKKQKTTPLTDISNENKRHVPMNFSILSRKPHFGKLDNFGHCGFDL